MCGKLNYVKCHQMVPSVTSVLNADFHCDSLYIENSSSKGTSFKKGSHMHNFQHICQTFFWTVLFVSGCDEKLFDERINDMGVQGCEFCMKWIYNYYAGLTYVC